MEDNLCVMDIASKVRFNSSIDSVSRPAPDRIEQRPQFDDRFEAKPLKNGLSHLLARDFWARRKLLYGRFGDFLFLLWDWLGFWLGGLKDGLGHRFGD
jgi:hypothetical protein